MSITAGLSPFLQPPLQMQAVGTPRAVPTATVSLGLTQIENHAYPKEFRDSDGTTWHLIKDIRDSSVDVPDPKTVTFTDAWGHKHLKPHAPPDIYLYAAEGMRAPRVPTEAPCRLLYVWASTTVCSNFTPAMVTPQEWAAAAVYSAPLGSSRESKLAALCGVETTEKNAASATPNTLIIMRDSDDGRAAQTTAGARREV